MIMHTVGTLLKMVVHVLGLAARPPHLLSSLYIHNNTKKNVYHCEHQQKGGSGNKASMILVSYKAKVGLIRCATPMSHEMMGRNMSRNGGLGSGSYPGTFY